MTLQLWNLLPCMGLSEANSPTLPNMLTVSRTGKSHWSAHHSVDQRKPATFLQQDPAVLVTTPSPAVSKATGTLLATLVCVLKAAYVPSALALAQTKAREARGQGKNVPPTVKFSFWKLGMKQFSLLAVSPSWQSLTQLRKDLLIFLLIVKEQSPTAIWTCSDCMKSMKWKENHLTLVELITGVTNFKN